MNKLNQWLTLVANFSVVVGIAFLAVQMRQNTEAIRSQTRDSITGKQMDFYGWVATDRDLARVYSSYGQSPISEIADPVDSITLWSFWQGVFREWENSHYQYQRGLFDEAEYQARVGRWRSGLTSPSARDLWKNGRETFAPDFRAVVDRIVAEVEQAQ